MEKDEFVRELLLAEWTPGMRTLFEPPRSKTARFGVTMVNWWNLSLPARQAILQDRALHTITGSVTVETQSLIVSGNCSLKEAGIIVNQIMNWLDEVEKRFGKIYHAPDRRATVPN